MGCAIGEACCHTIGIICAILSAVLLIGGFVLIILFSADFDDFDDWSVQYVAGIIAICVGTILTLCTLVYTCCVFRNKWKVFGCMEIKSPKKHITALHHHNNTNTLPSREDLNNARSGIDNKAGSLDLRPSHYNGAAVIGDEGKYKTYREEENSSSNNNQDTRETDWDPDTILGADFA